MKALLSPSKETLGNGMQVYRHRMFQLWEERRHMQSMCRTFTAQPMLQRCFNLCSKDVSTIALFAVCSSGRQETGREQRFTWIQPDAQLQFFLSSPRSIGTETKSGEGTEETG